MSSANFNVMNLLLGLLLLTGGGISCFTGVVRGGFAGGIEGGGGGGASELRRRDLMSSADEYKLSVSSSSAISGF